MSCLKQWLCVPGTQGDDPGSNSCRSRHCRSPNLVDQYCFAAGLVLAVPLSGPLDVPVSLLGNSRDTTQHLIHSGVCRKEETWWADTNQILLQTSNLLSSSIQTSSVCVQMTCYLVRLIPISPPDFSLAAYSSSCWWRQYAPLKRQSTPRLHSAVSEKAVITHTLMFPGNSAHVWC
jgi:hypothetical protein